MSSRTLVINCLLGQQRAITSLTDGNPPSLKLFAANTYRLQLNPVAATGSQTVRYAASKFSEFDSFEAALVVIDAPPVRGSWKLKVQGQTQTTDALDFNVNAAVLQTKLNALTAVQTGGGVTVIAGNVPNVFIIRPVNVATDFTFESALNQLTPTTSIRIRKASDGGGTYTMIKLRQGWLAGTDSFEFPTPPEVTCTIQRAGSTSANCIQLLTVPAGAMGVFELQHAGASTTLMKVVGLTAAIVEAALNALFADGATNPRFRCFDGTDGVSVQIECIGALAKQVVSQLIVTMYGQVPTDSPVADFAVTPVPVELLVSGKDNVAVQLEVAAFTASGAEHTLMRQPVTLYNTMLTRADSETFAAVAVKYIEVMTGADPDQAAIIGFMSQPKVLEGAGTTRGTGEYLETFAHNLNVIDPIVHAWELLDPSGSGKWRLMKDTEFDARSDGNPNSVKVALPFIPPTSGHVGSVRIRVINPDAQAALNDHRHSDTAIDCTGANAGKTLAQVLTILAGAMPDGWPTVPGAALADGSIEPSKLNLAALIAALFSPTGAQTAAVLTQLREMVKDPTLVSNIFTALSTSTQLTTQLTAFSQKILQQLSKTPELAKALQDTIATDAGLSKFFGDLVTAALQDGATVKDAVVLIVPDVDVTFPLPEFSDVSDEDGFAALPKAFLGTPTEDGDITGKLPKATPSLAGHYRTVVGAAWTQGHAREFADGQLVYCTGAEWFAGVLDSGKLFTTDFDVELLNIDLDADMLAVGTRFSLLAGIAPQQLGNCEGSWLLTLVRGHLSAESGPGNLNTFVADETVISRRITLSPTIPICNFGVTVSRTADTTFTATKTLYTVTGTATAPSSANISYRARLSRYDTQNVTAPRGIVKATMKGVRASITKLT